MFQCVVDCVNIAWDLLPKIIGIDSARFEIMRDELNVKYISEWQFADHSDMKINIL